MTGILTTLHRYKFWILTVLATAVFFYCARAVEMEPMKLLEGRAAMFDYLSRMWPPDPKIFSRVLDETLQTVELAFVATVIAAFVSVPIGFLAAANVMRTPFERLVARLTRFFLNANRAIDVLIVATLFVAAVGLGPFPGTLALAVHSVGMLGKMFFESIEGVDKGPVDALEAAGANRLQVLRWAIFPQVLPYFASHTLLRFELNVRGAVVLGLVGAGGIGALLMEKMKLFQSQAVATILLTILVLVMGIDTLSGWARRRLL